VHCHDSECAADRGVGQRDGACATARRRSHDVQPRQPAEHVDPRGSDAGLSGADNGVFNNLVMFGQHVKQNSLQSIVPDLATGWSWNEDGTELTFPLRNGVKWHDGTPFTDVNGCEPRFMRAHSPGSRDNVARNAIAHSPRSRGRTMPLSRLTGRQTERPSAQSPDAAPERVRTAGDGEVLFRRDRLRPRHRRPIGPDLCVPRAREATAADLVA